MIARKLIWHYKRRLLPLLVAVACACFLKGVLCLEVVSEVLVANKVVVTPNNIVALNEEEITEISVTKNSEKVLPQMETDNNTVLPNNDNSKPNANQIFLKSSELEDSLENITQPRRRPYYWSTQASKKNRSKPNLGFTKPTSYHDTVLYDDLSNAQAFDNHACRRNCQPGKSLSCYYQFIVHNYQRLGPDCQRCQSDVNACEREHCIFGDGVPTPVMAVNRMVPGPAIEVCQNDTVIVDVTNYLLEPLTMHWHGMPMVQTPDMDGAPYITQYPIQPGELYRYTFFAERSGTVWYHSHLGWQRALGVAGNFVIRQTRQQNRQASLYDYDLIEHTLMVQDIFYNYDFQRVRNILINGKGRNHLSSIPDNDPRNRYERVRVTPGYRYRMRVTSNGISDCPIEFSIENHKMLMIASDGNDIAPVLAESFFMSSAERFDFVLSANQYARNYWIRVRGYGNCSQENLYQGAVLHYSGATRNATPLQNLFEQDVGRNVESVDVVVVNRPPQLADIVKDSIKNKKAIDVPTASLRALSPLPWSPNTKFLTYYSSLGNGRLPNGYIVFQIDGITFQLPSVSLLQSRNIFKENALFCNRTSLLAAGRDCTREYCTCTNVIRLPAYRPIELVVVNYMFTTHPVHVHGYTFRVVGQGIIGNVTDLRRVQELDRRGALQRSPPDFAAVEKDTVQVPGLGYIIVRFLSNNPGYWLYHCHIDQHAQQGMAAVLKIGEEHQIKRTPPKIHF